MVVVTLPLPPGPVFEPQADATSGVAARTMVTTSLRSLGILDPERTATRSIVLPSENVPDPQSRAVTVYQNRAPWLVGVLGGAKPVPRLSHLGPEPPVDHVRFVWRNLRLLASGKLQAVRGSGASGSTPYFSMAEATSLGLPSPAAASPARTATTM